MSGAYGKATFRLVRQPDKLIDFIWRLINNTKHMVFLILDNLRIHHAKKVSLWLEKHKDEIEVFFLPPYSPEYNPDEYLNGDLKRDVGNRPMPRSERDIVKDVRSHMMSLQINADKAKSFYAL